LSFAAHALNTSVRRIDFLNRISENRSQQRVLAEMPVRNYSFQGDPDKPGSMAAKDIALIRRPSHEQRVRKAFQKTPYVFDLIFYNHPDYSFLYRDRSEFSPQFREFTKQFSGEMTPSLIKYLGVNTQPDPATITCVYLSNANVRNTMPLTPWIIAHRFVHALRDAWSASRLSEPLSKAVDVVKTAAEWNSDSMTMRSYRELDLDTFTDEVFEEVVAQYLITGRAELRGGKPEEVAHLNDDIKHLLDLCVGKTFITP